MSEMPEDVRSPFLTHSSYVEAFAWIAGLDSHTPRVDALRRMAVRSPEFADDRVPGSIDCVQVEKSLRHAWSTEVLLAMPRQLGEDADEFLRLANSWVAVQTYYVGYHAEQALIVAKGLVRPTQHPATRSQFSAHWAGRSLILPPFTFAVDKDGWRNVPAGVTVDDSMHAWRGLNHETAWNLAGKALRTTRDAAVKDLRDRRRDERLRDLQRARRQDESKRLAAGKRARSSGSPSARPRLTAAEQRVCDESVRAFTMLDYLYRLRVSANYKDSTVFHEGPEGEHESRSFHRNLTFLASSLALATELRVRALVGATRFDGWAKNFADARIGAGLDLGIRSRIELGLF